MAKGKPVKLNIPEIALPLGEDRELAPDELALDPGNLRLLETTDEALMKTEASLIGQPAVQRKVLEAVSDQKGNAAIDALEQSILANTFLKHERFVVAPLDNDQYIVLEGNRRLTAIRRILARHRADSQSVPKAVLDSLARLPCLVLPGPPISGKEQRLRDFRKQAEIYVGMRHLMGAREWSPASRYEFQARLVDEGWTVDMLASRFGRTSTEILRDLKAQRLFHEYRSFRQRRAYKPASVTYNIFAEAARSKPVMAWLGWSDEKSKVTNAKHRDAFFQYVTTELSRPDLFDDDATDDSDEPTTTRRSAERAVRQLTEMLKLGDDDINAALASEEFAAAKKLYATRKNGVLAQRISKCIALLENAPTAELRRDPDKLLGLLKRLSDSALGLSEIIGSLSKGRKK